MTTAERPATLCEAFQRTAAIDPDAVALRTPGGTQTLTWRELAAQVRQVAAAEGNAKLSRVEQIKRFRILPTLWEPGGDEITLTMKLKRKPVHAKYSGEIDELYSADLHPEVHEPAATVTAQPV